MSEENASIDEKEATKLRVILALEQSCHDATKRELASIRSKLDRKPYAIKVAGNSFRPIAEAEMTPGAQIIGYCQETGAVYRCHASVGTLVKRDPHYRSEEVFGWWVYNSGQLWQPTHFLPFPGDAGTPE